MKTIVSTLLAAMLFIGAYATSITMEEKELNTDEKQFSVELFNVSPEFEANENGTVEISSAFLVKQNDSSNELFGSFWAEFEFVPANTSGNYETQNWKVSDIRLGDNLSAEELKQVELLLLEELNTNFNEVPMASLNTGANAKGNTNSSALSTQAPLIIYSNFPSALLVIDGEPFYEDLDKRYSRISNVGSFMIKDGKQDTYYLYGGGLWFSSKSATNGWSYLQKVPNRIKKVMRKHARDLYDSMNEAQKGAQVVPEIIVSTEPSELISTDGTPEYEAIPEANLAYVKNTDAELFKDLATNKYYSLFSGRWFTSERLEANWKFLTAGTLPKGFAKIPEDHDKSKVLVSVPGTKAATDAIRDAQVPNVSKKDVATLLDTEVSYNGEPEFVAIEGTELDYALNTTYPVMRWNKRYYLVEEAVWYNSSSPYGPWRIATQRPQGVEEIPASNPLFNLKYVYIYKQTEKEVYTGYTSGYTGSYVDGPTVVYGTGYHYRGWYGHHYYHHPITYGFGFYYHPFYGWGPIYSPWYHSSFYWHWHWRPWYGYRPPYYRPPYYRPPGHRPPHHRPKPEHPIERPGRPGRPEQPSTLPAQPGTRPTQPSTRPTQPSTRPTQPSTRPSQPAVRPTPTPRPSQPSYRPSRPAPRPSQPSMRPSPRPAPRPSPGPARMR